VTGQSHAPCGDCDAMATARVRRGWRASAGAKRARACDSEGAAARAAATGGARERAAAAAAARSGLVVKLPRADISAEERTAVTAAQAGPASHALPCPRLLRLLQCPGAERPRWRRRSRSAPCLGRRGRPRAPASRSLPAIVCFRPSPRGSRTRYRLCLSSCSGLACTWRSTVRARRGGRAARAAATVQADSSALASPRRRSRAGAKPVPPAGVGAGRHRARHALVH
jgi:hypothetical protein